MERHEYSGHAHGICHGFVYLTQAPPPSVTSTARLLRDDCRVLSRAGADTTALTPGIGDKHTRLCLRSHCRQQKTGQAAPRRTARR